MSKKVKLNIWLSDCKREEFITVYKKLHDKYDAINQNIFSSIEESSKEYADTLVEKYGQMYDYESTDPSDIYEDISYEAYEYYRMEKLMEYNIKLGFLTTIYQILEQQLRKFIYEELNQSFSPVRTGSFFETGINMGEIKSLYKLSGYDLETSEYWDEISILADIVNTFKHGTGRSSERLYKKKPDLFLKSYFSKERLIDQELTSNTAIVLNLDEVNFNQCLDVIISFWQEFPEHITGEVTLEDKRA